MPAYKNKENGSWYVSAYYKNWKGEQTRKVKRGSCHNIQIILI